MITRFSSKKYSRSLTGQISFLVPAPLVSLLLSKFTSPTHLITVQSRRQWQVALYLLRHRYIVLAAAATESQPSNPQAESWAKALDQHRRSFISLVIDVSPLHALIHQLLGGAPPHPNQMGYRVSMAEMHRMYMRALQIEVVQIAAALQFDINAEDVSQERRVELEAARQGAQQNLEPAMGKYSTIS